MVAAAALCIQARLHPAAPERPVIGYAVDVVAYVGSSGFSYAEWKGIFYPSKLPNRSMLAFYAERLPSVELNSTFYRLPRAQVLETWRNAVPATFRFAVKAPKAITHYGKLVASNGPLARFLEVLQTLQESLGVVLFQLPPTHRADPILLRDFIQELPSGLRAAFEFRHPSWFTEATLAVLASGRCALVGGDTDDAERSPPLEVTAPFIYLRLRKSEYAPGELETWARLIRGLGGVQDSFVYFKHEQTAPELAARLLESLRGTEAPPSTDI